MFDADIQQFTISRKLSTSSNIVSFELILPSIAITIKTKTKTLQACPAIPPPNHPCPNSQVPSVSLSLNHSQSQFSQLNPVNSISLNSPIIAHS
jgi:hypothetical protein